MDNKQNKKNADVEVGLIVVSVAILAAFIIFMIFNPESTLNVISSFFNLMISVLGPFFELIAVVAFLVGLYLLFGKYGNCLLYTSTSG